MLTELLLPATKALEIGFPGTHLGFVVGLPAAAVLLRLGSTFMTTACLHD